MAIDWQNVPPSLIRALRDENQHPVAGWITPDGDFVSLELVPPERESDPWVILRSDEEGVEAVPGGQHYTFEDAVDGFIYESEKMGRDMGGEPEYLAGSDLEPMESRERDRRDRDIEFRDGMSLYDKNGMDGMGSRGIGRSRRGNNRGVAPSHMNITFK